MPPAVEQWASTVLHDPQRYPMFAEAYAVIDGVGVVAQVQHHTFQGATGKTGCFRGVSIFRATGTPVTYVEPGPSGQSFTRVYAPTPDPPSGPGMLELLSFAILAFSTGFGVTWAVCKDGCGR